MLIEVKPEALDGIVRAWLEDVLENHEFGIKYCSLHPDDVKEYKKDIKAVKRLLEYIGEQP